MSTCGSEYSAEPISKRPDNLQCQAPDKSLQMEEEGTRCNKGHRFEVVSLESIDPPCTFSAGWVDAKQHPTWLFEVGCDGGCNE